MAILDENEFHVITWLCDAPRCRNQDTFTGRARSDCYRGAREAGWRFWKEGQSFCPDHEEGFRDFGAFRDMGDTATIIAEGRASKDFPPTPPRKPRKKRKKRQ